MERIRPTSGGGQTTPRPSSRPSLQSKALVGSLVVIGVVMLIALGAWTFVSGSPVKSDRYQAVFLTNGQVYFGKLSNTNSDYVKLNDIYYLQVTQTDAESGLQNESNTVGQQISLAKLGNELHAPEDEMFISRDQVLFWENLKEEGQVTDAISDYVESGGADANNASPNGALNSGSDSGAGAAGGTQPAGTPALDDTANGDETLENAN